MTDTLTYIKKLFAASGVKNGDLEAERICDMYDSLGYIIQTDEFSLSDATACSGAASHIIRLTAALTSRRITDRFKPGKRYSSDELQQYAAGLLLGLCVETVYMIMLDSQGKLISAEYMGEGTVNASGFLPRKFLDTACRYGASTVILAHNHPCGSPVPSEVDIMTTSALVPVFRSAGINLAAHYVTVGFDVCDCMKLLTMHRETEEKTCVIHVNVVKENEKGG